MRNSSWPPLSPPPAPRSADLPVGGRHGAPSRPLTWPQGPTFRANQGGDCLLTPADCRVTIHERRARGHGALFAARAKALTTTMPGGRTVDGTTLDARNIRTKKYRHHRPR